MSITLRPLGKVREIVQSIGMEVSYAYDDLVFSDHSLFIIRFDNQDLTRLHLYFNVDCNTDEAKVVETRLINAGKIGDFKIVTAGKFQITQPTEKEEIEIKFIEKI